MNCEILSLQLWHRYLIERARAIRHLPPSHSSYEALNNAFERALVTMHKMPRIWLEHISSLKAQVGLLAAMPGPTVYNTPAGTVACGSVSVPVNPRLYGH